MRAQRPAEERSLAQTAGRVVAVVTVLACARTLRALHRGLRRSSPRGCGGLHARCFQRRARGGARHARQMLTQRVDAGAPYWTRADSGERTPKYTDKARSVGRCGNYKVWGTGAHPAGDARSVRDSSAWTDLAARVRSGRSWLSLAPRGNANAQPPLRMRARPALVEHARPAALCCGGSPSRAMSVSDSTAEGRHC